MNSKHQIGIIHENDYFTFHIKNKIFYEDKAVKPLHYLLLDSCYEIKNINIPIVSHYLIGDVVKNAIKKYTTIPIFENNVDFRILNKKDKEYEIIVFIHKLEPDHFLEKQKKYYLYTPYTLIESFINEHNPTGEYNIILQENDYIFIYQMINSRFNKRVIYKIDDTELQQFNDKKNFHLRLPDNNTLSSGIIAETIDNKLLKEIIADLPSKKSFFNRKTKFPFKFTLFWIIISILSLSIIYTSIIFHKLSISNQNLDKRINKLIIDYNKEKQKKGVSSVDYQKYLRLIDEKSNLNKFFFYLYNSSNGNVEIKNLYFSENNFNLEGICQDDSKLESNFRKYDHWKDISFSFSRKNNIIFFKIRGKLISE